jgi:protein involved in polysaccharide export with SLBB domain
MHRIGILAFALTLVSCAGHREGSGIAPQNQQLLLPKWGSSPPEHYLLNIGDEIEVKFYYHPELNERTVIRPDGKISLLLVDAVKAAALTPEQLDEELTSLYSGQLERVDLTVIVRGYASQDVFVDGEINRPQPIPLKGSMTLVQAIIAAGGPKETAQMGKVLLIRPLDAEEFKVFEIDLQTPEMWAQNNILLKPLDIIYVPKTSIAKANIFVEQYLSNMVPDWIRISFPFPYSLGGERSVTVTTE